MYGIIDALLFIGLGAMIGALVTMLIIYLIISAGD